MPPATGLQFYRKRQSIDHLSLERPQSLQIFRECITKALISVESRIELLQQSYYGHDKNIEQEIKRWLPTLNVVMRQARVSFLLNKSALKDTFAMYERAKGDPTLKVDFDKEAIKTVMECIDRVVQYLKTGFGDIIKDMRALADYMTKYCLSFSDIDGDAYLDTAFNYERQRHEFLKGIKFNIDDITDMAEKFETTGLRVADLGFVARDLAEKNECVHTPFLVIIPQAFENLKNALNDMRKWVKADEGYADFINFDIIDLEKRKEVQEKKVRDVQVKCSNCDHKIKTLQRELGDCIDDVNRFHNREKALKVEKQDLINENKDVLFDLDIKQFRKDELKPMLEELNRSELEKYKQLEREIAVLSEKRPTIDKKLDDINKKLKIIQDRKEGKSRKEKQLSEARAEARTTKKEWRRTEVELERIDACLSRLKEIHRYKTTPEILKKIFHNMPLTARHVVNKGKKPINGMLVIQLSLVVCQPGPVLSSAALSSLFNEPQC